MVIRAVSNEWVKPIGDWSPEELKAAGTITIESSVGVLVLVEVGLTESGRKYRKLVRDYELPEVVLERNFSVLEVRE